jgi:hypothetical protein
MSHHFIHFRISSETHTTLSPASVEPTYYDTIEPMSHEDQVFDSSTLYDSDDEDPWIPYTGQPYRHYYTRQDLESQPLPFCNSPESCSFMFSQAPIWITVLVCVVAVVGFGIVLGFFGCCCEGHRVKIPPSRVLLYGCTQDCFGTSGRC